ncbi:hypothetical protein [Lentzea jiangxiensis]|uniref:Uncharacterized protein n=1 Tax=Lentzea jiangxiensis TaxID=641025 RepID=A0A1H0RT19_9PSEU|nr:hypothetical protein [Lentzea jiangxiensis]SDP32560.1 hypothetical protein SAMN05421507_10766 [Lentzea jiangxiensis]
MPDEALDQVVHLFPVTGGPDADAIGIRDPVADELSELYRLPGVTAVPEVPPAKAGKADKRKLRRKFR